MDDRLIEFKGAPARPNRKRTRVTLNGRGVFLLNTAAMSALKKSEAVKLFYDPHKQVIGLQPATTFETNSFPLGVKDEAMNRTINASSFCKHFDIKVLRTIEFNNPRVGDDGIMRLNLTDTTIIGREPSKRKSI
jgi:hypothetical protein